MACDDIDALLREMATSYSLVIDFLQEPLQQSRFPGKLRLFPQRQELAVLSERLTCFEDSLKKACVEHDFLSMIL